MSTEIQNVQSPTVEVEPKKLEGEALKEAILRQVDYYFSRQNLSNDAYLVSQMRKDAKGMYVALKTIAAFTKVKNLSEDLQLITEVMKTSKSVAVDESNGDIILRPTHLNATRNTLMLRDIPSATDPETIKQIFVNEKSAVPLSLQSAIGDNWFITFESEADAVKALEFIRTQTFNGKRMSGCLKSENLLKSSTFPAMKNGDAPAETSTGSIFQAQGMPYAQQRWNRNPPMPQPYTATATQYVEFYDNTYRQNKNRPYSANPRRGGATGTSQPRRKDGSPTYHKKGQYQATNGAAPQLATPTNPTAEQTPIAPTQPAYNTRQPKQPSTQPADAQNARKKSPTPGAEKKRRGSKNQGRQAMPNLTANDFPPLPSLGKDENKTGYETTFKRYTKQEIIDVVSSLGSGNAPAELPSDVPAVISTPNAELELLKPLPKSDKGEEKVEPAVKSFAEAAITAKDIKTPEHKDGRARRNSKRSENVITASTAQTNSKRSGKPAQTESTDAPAESTPAATPAAEDEFKEVKHSKRNRKNVPQAQQPQTASSPTEGENATADATDATVDAILKKKAQKNNRQRRNNAEQAGEQSQDSDSKKATTYADIVAAKKAAAEKSKQEAAAAEKSAAAAAAATPAAAPAPADAVSPPGK